jgi:hypothetical protein
VTLPARWRLPGSPRARARPGRARLGTVLRTAVIAAVVASLAGCVGMPSNGPVQEFSASPQSSAQDGNLIGSVPLGPQPGEDPAHVVEGFLTAADSYPLYSVALEYLTSSAVKRWNPQFAVDVFSKMNPPATVPAPKASPTSAPQAKVELSGTIQSTFNGTGQYISANSGQASAAYDSMLSLVKVGGQWRIVNPPNYRMLQVGDFPYFYKTQDLYFMDPQDDTLVPDSVFVPLGATVSQLLTDLVDSLTGPPKTPWLASAIDTELPPDYGVQQVLNDGSTVTVNISVPRGISPDPHALELFAAQLVWTLTSPAGFSSVVLEINGQPWPPTTAPCPNGRIPAQAQTSAYFSCFNPYPSSPSAFYYVYHGQSWARCGAESLGASGSIGPVLPLVGHTGVFTSPGCVPGQSVSQPDPTQPAAQPPSLPAVTMVALSPDGTYLAIVTAGRGDLYVGKPSGPAASFATGPGRLSGGDVTSLSWDRNDNLWMIQGGTIYELKSSELKPGGTAVPVAGPQNVTDLSVAPDGVRLAFIAQSPGGGYELDLAALYGGPATNVVSGSPSGHEAIKGATVIGPGLSHPASVAWYDADDLLVVNDAAGGNELYEVPVDGQQPQQVVAPTNVTSITADGPQNLLVAGVAGGSLAVSTSLIGPWDPLGTPGAYPAYPG